MAILSGSNAVAIWHQAPSLEALNEQSKNTIGEVLEIVITGIGDDYLRGRMPVDRRTHQPFGILHGGASVVLAESLGSMAANLVVNPQTHYCVGLDINANHLKSVREGFVLGTARPIHLGKSTQVWDIRICDEHGRDVGRWAGDDQRPRDGRHLPA